MWNTYVCETLAGLKRRPKNKYIKKKGKKSSWLCTSVAPAALSSSTGKLSMKSANGCVGCKHERGLSELVAVCLECSRLRKDKTQDFYKKGDEKPCPSTKR